MTEKEKDSAKIKAYVAGMAISMGCGLFCHRVAKHMSVGATILQKVVNYAAAGCTAMVLGHVIDIVLGETYNTINAMCDEEESTGTYFEDIMNRERPHLIATKAFSRGNSGL